MRDKEYGLTKDKAEEEKDEAEETKVSLKNSNVRVVKEKVNANINVEKEEEQEEEKRSVNCVNMVMECALAGESMAQRNKELIESPDIFILDTGASTNSTGNGYGMYDLKDPKGSVTRMGNGKMMAAKAIGCFDVTVCKAGGQKLGRGTVTDLHLIPSSPFNLISGGALMLKGYAMSGTTKGIVFAKGNTRLIFDVVIRTNKGTLFACLMKRKEAPQETGMATTDTDRVITMTVQQAHERLDHCDEKRTRAIAKQLGWHTTKGKLLPCESCAIGKAKKKKVRIVDEPSENKATAVNGRVYLDISMLKRKEESGFKPKRNNWRIMVDEFTSKKFSDFFATKNGMVEPTCERFHRWKTEGKQVAAIRMDNAGEKLLLEKRFSSSAWKLNPKFEYTAKDTPQQNHLA